jgi:hypothetical protein
LRAIVFDTGSQKKERKKKKKENEQSSGFKARGKLDQDCFNSTLTRHQAAVGRQKNLFFFRQAALFSLELKKFYYLLHQAHLPSLWANKAWGQRQSLLNQVCE